MSLFESLKVNLDNFRNVNDIGYITVKQGWWKIRSYGWKVNEQCFKQLEEYSDQYLPLYIRLLYPYYDYQLNEYVVDAIYVLGQHMLTNPQTKFDEFINEHIKKYDRDPNANIKWMEELFYNGICPHLNGSDFDTSFENCFDVIYITRINFINQIKIRSHLRNRIPKLTTEERTSLVERFNEIYKSFYPDIKIVFTMMCEVNDSITLQYDLPLSCNE